MYEMGARESEKPLFIMCFGAQKAGTSWLFNQIKQHPESAFEHLPRKEAHFFNRPERSGLRKPHRKISRILKSRWKEPIPSQAKQKAAWSAYIDMQLSAAAHGAVGDFTPDYCLLTSKHWKQVVQALSPHFDLRFVFLVRDPIERMKSALKHGLRAPESGILGRPFSDASAAFEWASRGGMELAHLAKSNYPKHLQSITQVVPPEAILIQRHEDLFSVASYNNILKHCGLSPVQNVQTHIRINSSAASEPGVFSEEQKERLQQKLAHVYRWADERWGEEQMRNIWPNHP
jgi:hypothetical protein